MLESFVINICIPVGDKMRAVNEYPIVVLGRESDMRNALAGNSVRDFIKAHVPDYRSYLGSVFNIRHLRRDNTDMKLKIRIPEIVELTEQDFISNT